MIRDSGWKAGQVGRNMEDKLKIALISAGYTELNDMQKIHLRAALRQGIDPAEYCRHANLGRTFVQRMKLFPSIYGIPWVSDAFVYRPDTWKLGLLLEIKSQDYGGSVDEKLPFVMLTMANLKRFAAVLLIGPGFRAPALDWAMQFGRRADPEIRVFRDWTPLDKLFRDGAVDDVATKLYAPNPQSSLF